ncbi:hypothetical protein F5148DRAFT_1148277 [Russula earlei]|uniref:Uncharacterized protein n=1 Tax=Russula earlei TaxID=71964 RepID=A0ACC0UD68_9AGAM|nr:hypothetical protein F5148DRAFT_1148277 [Russula earlei]
MSRNKRSELPASSSCLSPPQRPQRRLSFCHDLHNRRITVAPTAMDSRRRQRTTNSPRAMFRAAAPPILFVIVIAGLLVELRARLTLPLPPPPPGVTVSMRGNTVMQRALIWAEARWSGPWAIPVVCAGAIGALWAVTWTSVFILDHFEERMRVSDAARVRVGRWEDGRTVSGGELLAGMFT